MPFRKPSSHLHHRSRKTLCNYSHRGSYQFPVSNLPGAHYSSTLSLILDPLLFPSLSSYSKAMPLCTVSLYSEILPPPSPRKVIKIRSYNYLSIPLPTKSCIYSNPSLLCRWKRCLKPSPTASPSPLISLQLFPFPLFSTSPSELVSSS